MISRKNRFHGHAVITRLRGEILHSQNFSMRFAKSNKKDYRLAVVVSKKIAPKAVDRNRIRRRLFEAVRTQSRLQNIAVDVVIYAKNQELRNFDYSTLSNEIADLTKKMLSRLK